jgi:hypothetical protein
MSLEIRVVAQHVPTLLVCPSNLRPMIGSAQDSSVATMTLSRGTVGFNLGETLQFRRR